MRVLALDNTGECALVRQGSVRIGKRSPVGSGGAPIDEFIERLNAGHDHGVMDTGLIGLGHGTSLLAAMAGARVHLWTHRLAPCAVWAASAPLGRLTIS